MVYTEKDGAAEAFLCPHCKTGLRVREWGTEYGDPLPGMVDMYCGVCGETFKAEVYVCVHVSPYPAPVNS